MTNYFNNRCSQREYSDKKIDLQLIYNLLESAAHAPNTGNMQWYSVVVTTDDNLLSQLRKCHFNQPAAVNSNCHVTFCFDTNRFEAWCKASNAKPGFENFQSFIAGIIDTSILAQQFTTLAELNNLGTCILGTTTYNAPEIGKILNLPKHVVPITTVAIGYRLQEMTPTERLPIEAIVHKDTYCDYTEQQIKNLYHDKEELDTNQNFTKENGKQSLAQVFTDIRYPKSNNELFSQKYLDYIIDQGFKFPY